MLEEIINIIFSIVFLGFLGFICHGAVLVINDKQKIWEQKQRGNYYGNDSRSESKKQSS